MPFILCDFFKSDIGQCLLTCPKNSLENQIYGHVKIMVFLVNILGLYISYSLRRYASDHDDDIQKKVILPIFV